MNKNQAVANVPVITVDGPSGSGKGTVSCAMASHLKWHLLDSGALYRILAFAVLEKQLPVTADLAISDLARGLKVEFVTQDSVRVVLLNGVDVSTSIRTEICGEMASKIASHPEVRVALLARQRDFAKNPGLVADGRDMGTVVFPTAPLKIFLEATPEERAKRRYLQLKARGIDANLRKILLDLNVRDERDKNRVVAPLKPAADAVLIETTSMSIAEVETVIITEAKKRHLI